MRRFACLLAAAAALAPIASGCGSDDLPSVTPAEAAAGTRDAQTARSKMVMKMSGMGLPAPITIKAEGVGATNAPRMDMTADFGPVLAAFGAGADAKVRLVLDGGRLLVDPPALPGVEVPGGATWVTADIGEVLEAFGVDAEGLGELMRLSTDQQIAAIQSAGEIKKVGEDEIDGVRTTHLRGEVRMSDYIEGLPPERRARVRKAIRQLENLPGAETGPSFDAPVPTDMWIDEEKRLRRMRSSTKLPAQQGMPGGSFTMTMDLTDFGTKLELPSPSGDDVYDATDFLVRALKQAR